MGCQSSSQALGQAPKEIEQQKYKVKDEHYPGGTRDVPKLEGSIEKSALAERRRRSKELSQEACQSDWKELQDVTDSTTSTLDTDQCSPVSSKLETPTKMSMKSFIRNTKRTWCAEYAKADGGMISDNPVDRENHSIEFTPQSTLQSSRGT
eukprot:gnl/TRDRNA2_/TRDRNA2_87601_c0_seq3.p1 gnl/TRDRNA2_/TRDRNA2_87601_c0~~gnl/TRDRNA2_/TRDRNA2_87601_c0_seq3.p1  ORF type:complete len:151 (-),score=22.61 gnl/TRDRNA2_/TRDRNA2_87601_c0_seq3:37-489(-)